MFTGGLPKYCLNYLTTHAPGALDGLRVVVGCSGSFGIEQAILSSGCKVVGVFSNDASLYSCALGWWLARQEAKIQPNEAAPEWVRRAWGDGERGIACLDALLEALDFEEQNNIYKQRMWAAHVRYFERIVEEKQQRMRNWRRELTGFYAGDVLEHFQQQDGDDAVFICYAPSYTTTYARLYRRLEEMFSWERPQYTPLDKHRRAELLEWMSQRRFLWFDNQPIAGRQPIMMVNRHSSKDIYLYGNAFSATGYIDLQSSRRAPQLTLADENLRLDASTPISVVEISPAELATYKDMFLNKWIEHKFGTYALAVLAGDVAIGFFEFLIGDQYYEKDEIYLQSDFAVPGTGYAHLSKLVVMLATSGVMRRFLERKRELYVRRVRTTAFTERPVSMKYRGVMKLIKRGEKDGKKYLNYAADFRSDTVEEVYRTWLKNNKLAN